MVVGGGRKTLVVEQIYECPRTGTRTTTHPWTKWPITSGGALSPLIKLNSQTGRTDACRNIADHTLCWATVPMGAIEAESVPENPRSNDNR